MNAFPLVLRQGVVLFNMFRLCNIAFFDGGGLTGTSAPTYVRMYMPGKLSISSLGYCG